MRRKTLLWGIMLVLLFTAALVGCSNANNSYNNNEQEAKNQASTNQESNGEETKPTLKILGSFAPNIDPAKDPMIDEIEQTTGYQVEYYMLPQDKPDEKLNIEVASGTDKDILTLTASQFYK